jgi:uncharacterized repeat protein (TIGR01451 family)
VASVALAALLIGPALAAADAPDVTSATGSIVSTDAQGNTTIEVHGTWAWSTHANSDCNGDKRGIGVAIDWGDNNANHVTDLNGDSIDVGTATDNVAHPAEPGSDVSTPGGFAGWRGGCGVYAKHGATSYNTGTGGPLTHVYPPGPFPRICALTYDVHLQSNGGPPNDASWITAGGAGHNTDNSAEKNGSHDVGNVCAQIQGLPPNPQTGGPGPTPNPAISIDKTGPATAQAGDLVPYVLTITNIGNVSFPAAQVVVADPLCTAAPTLTSKNDDKSEGTFDPKDVWTYACSVQTTAGQTQIDNVATVTAKDTVGRTVTDDDPASTVLAQRLQPVQYVLALLPGSARLRGPAGCLAGGPKKLVVTGRRIARVRFFLDGKLVATKTKRDSKGRFTYTVNRKNLRTGLHTVVVRISYLPDTTGGARTFRRTFAKCARALKPAFTG